MRLFEQQQLTDNRVCERPWAGGMAEKKGREQRNERREKREGGKWPQSRFIAFLHGLRRAGW